jgi:hypothetical protein
MFEQKVLLWIGNESIPPNGGGGGPSREKNFVKIKKNYTAGISCSIRTELSVQVSRYYRSYFFIRAQNLTSF